MKGALDSQSIELPCPHCSRKLRETIGKIKTNPILRCRQCGKDFQVNAEQFTAKFAKVEKALANMQRSLRRLGK